MHDGWALKSPAYQSVPPFEHTYGPQVVRLCNQAGYPPDPEQSLVLDAMFGVTDEGLSAAFEGAVVAPRQNLKTGVEKQAALGWIFVTQVEVVTWSAHEFPTAKEAFGDLVAIIDGCAALRRRLAKGPSNGIYAGNVDPRIELADGRQIKFKARTNTGSRGLTGDKIILDEAFALMPEHTGSLIPTLTAVPDPQILYGSSAGMAKSAVLRDIRNRGRAGAPSLAYFEWCAPRRECARRDCDHPKPGAPGWAPGCALDDEELWAAANPLLGRQRSNGTGLTLEKMRKFHLAEPPAEWMRERLGWWDEVGAESLFGEGKWSALRVPIPAETMPTALGVAVSVDLGSAAIVAAARVGDRRVILPVEARPGTEWVTPAVRELAAELGVPVVVDRGGPAGFLAADLPNVSPITLAQYADACAEVERDVMSGVIGHDAFPELDEAVGSATRRNVGDRSVWGRRGSGNIVVFEAATCALWGEAHAVSTAVPPPLPEAIDVDHSTVEGDSYAAEIARF